MGESRISATIGLRQRFNQPQKSILYRYFLQHLVNSVNETKFMSKHEDKVLLDFIVS